jgi:capsid protein
MSELCFSQMIGVDDIVERAWDDRSRWHVRAFESAEYDPLTASRWSRVVGETTINEEIEASQSISRAKAVYEGRNSSLVRGVIHSHSIAVVGAEGPTLDLQCTIDSDDHEEWCIAAEKVWNDFSGCGSDIYGISRCEASGKLHFADLLQQWIGLLWTCGEALGVKVEDPDRPADDPIGWRIMNINPSRLYSPPNWSRVGRLGVRTNVIGRPTGYWIGDGNSGGREISSDRIYHLFLETEPEQLRGVPLINTCLNTAADIRDYDAEVLAAARAAAALSMFAYTTDPEAEYKEPPKDDRSVSYRRGQLNYLRPKWQLASNPATQPSASYRDHRHERMPELGRPVSMPGLIVRQDASGHNYSSARFDYAQYCLAIEVFQRWLTRRCVERLRREVTATAILSGVLPRQPPGVIAIWTWPQPQPIDELKNAEAEAIQLDTGTISFSEACKRRGTTAERVALQRRRDSRLLKKHGLRSVEREDE